MSTRREMLMNEEADLTKYLTIYMSQYSVECMVGLILIMTANKTHGDMMKFNDKYTIKRSRERTTPTSSSS